VRRRARRLAWAYLIVAVGLIVWTVFLALSLPKENLEHHFRLTWTGFDLIEVLAICLTAYWAFRLDARVVYPATAVATLLVADAWFDVTTSTTAADATQALILALAVELPAAAFTLYLAHRVGRRVRELAHPGHVTGPHPPVPDRAQVHPAFPAGSSAPVEPPPQE
jgi:nitrate/nitrite transporter NarK